MSAPRRTGLFFENAVYKRNRLIDAARLLPILGAVMFIMPAMFIVTSAPTATRWVYLFVVWMLLIIAAALISRALRKSENPDGSSE